MKMPVMWSWIEQAGLLRHFNYKLQLVYLKEKTGFQVETIVLWLDEGDLHSPEWRLRCSAQAFPLCVTVLIYMMENVFGIGLTESAYIIHIFM